MNSRTRAELRGPEPRRRKRPPRTEPRAGVARKMLELSQSPAPWVDVNDTARQAVRELRGSLSGALVVVEDGKLAGILSERALLHGVVGKGLDPRTTKVRDVMSEDVITVAPDADVKAAFTLMATRRVRHLVVVDGEGRPLGLVSLRALAQARIDLATEEIRTLREYANDSLGG